MGITVDSVEPAGRSGLVRAVAHGDDDPDRRGSAGMDALPLAGRVAGAPISWGVCEVPGWGHVLDVDQVLGEMSGLGLTHTELGPPGFLPEDGATTAKVLAAHDLTLVGGFLAVPLHDESALEATVAQARTTAATIAAAGGTVVVLAAATGLDGYDARPVLSDAEWVTLVASAARVREVAAQEGLTTVLHPHVGTHVETAAEVARFLADSDLDLCLDTGHLLIGGCDPLRLAREHSGRVAHVHLKDVTFALAAQVRSGELTYMQAVQQRMYVPLGEGDVPVGEIVATLEAAGYRGWYVLEQDTSLPDGAPQNASVPIRDVEASLRHLTAMTA